MANWRREQPFERFRQHGWTDDYKAEAGGVHFLVSIGASPDGQSKVTVICRDRFTEVRTHIRGFELCFCDGNRQLFCDLVLNHLAGLPSEAAERLREVYRQLHVKPPQMQVAVVPPNVQN